jgi:hypothetical protein
MSDARPRAVLVSEIGQLLLLCEPIWRALKLNSIVSLIGTSVLCLIAATIVLLATRRKKIWARDFLGGLALFAVLVWLVVLGFHFFDPDWRTEEAIFSMIWLFINVTAVALLFTKSAMEWFGDLSEYEPTSGLVQTGRGAAMGWFMRWFNRVDIGLRPRNVFKGTDVNLYPFTRRGVEWIEQNLHRFSQPVWSQRERCLMLSKIDSSPIGLSLIVGMLQQAGLKLRFYGRLKGWDGASRWVG